MHWIFSIFLLKDSLFGWSYTTYYWQKRWNTNSDIFGRKFNPFFVLVLLSWLPRQYVHMELITRRSKPSIYVFSLEIPSISLGILGVSVPHVTFTLRDSATTIANLLYLVCRVKVLVLQNCVWPIFCYYTASSLFANHVQLTHNRGKC